MIAAAGGEAVDYVRAVGRGLPPVERDMTLRRRQPRWIDEQAVASVLAHEELVILRAGGALLEEQLATGKLHIARGHRVRTQFADAPQQRRARGNGIEHRARVGVLSAQPRQPVGAPVVLHPPVGIRQRLAEIGVAGVVHACDRRWRDHRLGGGHRTLLRKKPVASVRSRSRRAMSASRRIALGA